MDLPMIPFIIASGLPDLARWLIEAAISPHHLRSAYLKLVVLGDATRQKKLQREPLPLGREVR
jgi:hypothetical protein